MADAYTSTSSVGLDTAAYQVAAHFALRAELQYDRAATVQGAPMTHVGSSVVFRFFADLAAATTPLSETVDVDAVAMSDSTVTLTLAEYGNAIISTRLARGTSYLPFNPIAANVIGYNAGITQDSLAATPLYAGTNVRYAGTATATANIATTDLLDSHDVRRARAELAAAHVQRIDGYYVAYIHPDVALDLKEETGAAAWVEPANYSDASRRWNGEIGIYEGFRFIEATQGNLTADGGATTVDSYATLFMGRDALAKAYSSTESGPNPEIRLSPVTDKLRRFQPIGWYWIAAYGRFREAALRRVESASSIGANA